MSKDDLVRVRHMLDAALEARPFNEFQQTHPDVPWAQIVGMRNRLIHAYFDVDVDRVWDTVVDDLPPLIKQLERLLK